MLLKFLPSALLFFVLTQGAIAIVCDEGGHPMPGCPPFAPCPPCASNEICCLTIGSQCIPKGTSCPRVDESN